MPTVAPPQWGVYILRCGDATLYTGCTNDIGKRLEAHASGKGAKYTKGRSPLTLIYWEDCADKKSALSREYAIKKMTRAQKETLCRL